MNRLLSLLFAALEAVLVAAIGIGIMVIPLTFLWGFQYGLGFDWAVVWRAAVDVWLLGHGVDLTVTLPADLVAQLAVAGLGDPFGITIAMLGLTLLTILLGVRAGTRIADGLWPLLGLATAAVTYLLVTVLLTVTAANPIVVPARIQSIIVPPLVFAIGLAIGAVRSQGVPALPARLRTAIGVVWPPVIRAGLSGGLMAVALITAVSAVLTAILVAIGYSEVIRLYESLQAGILGGILLTILQLLLLPNIVIWVSAWLIGPGFMIGTGSSVSPVGTQLGPIPAVPIFGAIPEGGHAFAFLGLLVPVVAGFLVGISLRSTRRRLAAVWDSRVPLLVAMPVLVGAAAAVTMGILAAASGGAAGPGRLADVGPNPWLVAGLILLEVGIPAGLGLLPGPRGPGAKL